MFGGKLISDSISNFEHYQDAWPLFPINTSSIPVTFNCCLRAGRFFYFNVNIAVLKETDIFLSATTAAPGCHFRFYK